MSEAQRSLWGLVLGLVVATSSGAGTVVKIRDVGPDDNRLVIAIAGDGYLASQEAAFVAHAEQALAGLLAASPYAEYAAWINAYAVFEASNEQGADKPAACFASPVTRDTRFDATYCTSGTQRLLTVNSGQVFALLNTDVPTWDLAAVVVNDTTYGGAGGSLLTFSIDPAAMVELFLHEAGHTFGRLADEYGGDPSPYSGSEPREPNVTLELDRELTKWAPWIDAGTPLPTPESEDWEPGLYLGGRYHDAGIWRPVNNCKMRSLNRAFCPICKEAHVQELHARISAIDAVSPDSPGIEVPPCGSATASLELLAIDPPTLEVEWRIDGLPLPGETAASIVIDRSLVPPGGGMLQAVVFDATPLVQRPYLSPMTASASWTLTALPLSDLDGDGLDDACDPDIDGDGVPNDEDCGPLDPAISAPAREVASLFVSRGAAGGAALVWEDVVALESRPGGLYALLTGLLSELSEDRGFARTCRLEPGSAPQHEDLRALPPLGSVGWYYLVAVEDDCGAGALGSSLPATADARSGLDPASTAACP